MKALTLHQYWAHAMAPLLLKKIETRGWYTPYRGLLAIHAAATVPAYARDSFECNAVALTCFAPLGIRAGNDLKKLPLGVIVGVCDLVACVTTNIERPLDAISRKAFYRPQPGSIEYAFGNYEQNRFMWITENMRVLESPIACTGHQRLWDVPEEILERLNKL
jgi:activating signal cointegrator 1